MTEKQTTELARVDLAKPVGDWATLGRVLKAQQGEIGKVIADLFDPEELARLALTSMRSGEQAEKMLACTGASVAKSFMDLAQSGLSPARHLGQCCFVPYKSELQFQVEYRGFITLAKRSGEVSYITADVVHEGDKFEFQRGTEQFLHHVPLGDTEQITHFYALVKLRDGATDFRVMTKAQIDKHRDRYSKMAHGPAWSNSYAAMGMKTVIRQLCKFLNLSPQLTAATIIDEYNEAGVGQPEKLEVGTHSFGFGARGRPVPVEVVDVTKQEQQVPAEAVPPPGTESPAADTGASAPVADAASPAPAEDEGFGEEPPNDGGMSEQEKCIAALRELYDAEKVTAKEMKAILGEHGVFKPEWGRLSQMWSGLLHADPAALHEATEVIVTGAKGR